MGLLNLNCLWWSKYIHKRSSLDNCNTHDCQWHFWMLYIYYLSSGRQVFVIAKICYFKIEWEGAQVDWKLIKGLIRFLSGSNIYYVNMIWILPKHAGPRHYMYPSIITYTSQVRIDYKIYHVFNQTRYLWLKGVDYKTGSEKIEWECNCYYNIDVI